MGGGGKPSPVTVEDLSIGQLIEILLDSKDIDDTTNLSIPEFITIDMPVKEYNELMKLDTLWTLRDFKWSELPISSKSGTPRVMQSRNNLEINSAGTIHVTPNPFDEYLTLHIDNVNSQKVNIVFMNVLGVKIKEQQWWLNGGENQVKLMTKDLEDGVYLLYVTGDQGRLLQTYSLIHQSK